MDLGRKPTLTASALVLSIVGLWLLLADQSRTSHAMSGVASAKFIFSTVPGFFVQDDLATDPARFDFVKHNFGLKDRGYDSDEPGDELHLPWERFEKYLKHLVNSSEPESTYKVLYLGRHGEGFHNVGEAKYGTKAWNEYWSRLDGDGELYWNDAHLTEVGKGQALVNNAFFRTRASRKMPAPERYYTSPLYRCLQTANFTFTGLDLPSDRPFRPMIKEYMREVMGEHTCDKRSSRAAIHEAVPEWTFEKGFREKDELWQPHHRETRGERDARSLKLLEDIFTNDPHLFLSFTTHSGALASLLRIIGHREYRLPTGGMMPVLIKATRVS